MDSSSRHKCIEDLLISSRQVISSISSSGLGSQGPATNLGGGASANNSQESTVVGGAGRCSPGSGSGIPSRPSPKENCRREYSRLNSNLASKDSSNMSKSDEQQSREVTNKPTDFTSGKVTYDGKKETRGERGKKKSSWYNVLYPTYKSRSDDFKRLFKDVPDDERLVVDYSCALQRDTILAQGRLYVSQNYVCFYANIFSWETLVSLRWKDVTSITKEKTAIVLPNAISICTATDKFFLTSFGARDKIYVMLFRVWQNALIGEPMSASEMWQLVHACYGDELGLTSDDEDYIPSLPPGDEEKMPTRASVDSFSEVEVIIPENLGAVTMGNSPSQSDTQVQSQKVDSAVEPTDLSDTTDNETTKHGSKPEVRSISVCNASHEGRLISKATLSIHIDQLFALLFSSSKFFLDFHTARKTTDLVQSGWTQDDDTAQKTRTLSLTIALSQSIGPRNTRVTETQVMLPCSKPGQLYSIDVESVNAGIPYADSFSVLTHYCLSSISENETSIAMYSQIKYKKSVWGIVKSVIEKNCWAGLEEYFTSLIKAVSAECEEISVNGGVKRKVRRRRRTTAAVTALQNHSPNHTITNHQITSSTEMPHIHDNTVPGARTDSNMIISSMLLVAILCLMVINGLLYYKLWGLEDAAAYTIMDLHVLKSTPKTEEDWINLLQHQESLHNVEMRKWQRVLHTAAQLLRQTEESLTELQMSIHPTVTEKMFSVLKPNLKSINSRAEQRGNSEL